MEDLKKILEENEHYKKLFGIGDLATKSYMAVVKMLGQQVDVMNTFDIRSSIDESAKESPKYARVMDMYEKMPKMISELHKLKNELGIEYVEKEERIGATTPQSVGFKKIENV